MYPATAKQLFQRYMHLDDEEVSLYLATLRTIAGPCDLNSCCSYSNESYINLRDINFCAVHYFWLKVNIWDQEDDEVRFL